MSHHAEAVTCSETVDPSVNFRGIRTPHRFWRSNGPSSSRLLLPANSLVTFFAAMCVTHAAAQRSDLAEKLGELNVRHTTEHYALAGTVGNARLEEYGRALEWIYGQYADGFRKLLEEEKKGQRGRSRGQTAKRKASDKGEQQEAKATGILDRGEDRRFPVIVFADGLEYREFGREFIPGGTENTGGMYLGGLGALLILDQPKADDTYGVLFHEAFHQFMRRYVKYPPMWLNEGLAVYYEGARPAGKGVRFTSTRKHYWGIARKIISHPEAIPLYEVVTANRPTFYDETPLHVKGYVGVHRKTLYYMEAYTLVHLLLSDNTGRERVQNYIRDLAQDDGVPARLITEKYFDQATCQQLTHHWIRHVNNHR